MKAKVFILAVSVLAIGCGQNRVSTAPASVSRGQSEAAVSAVCPKPGDIGEFKPDLVSARTHFKDFKVERKKLEDILLTWYRVSQEHWRHGYSHVAFGDRTGTIKLKDGTAIRWMVRPGGLARLTFQDGTTLYLAKELTPWKKDAEPAAAPSRRVGEKADSGKDELQLTCWMGRTAFVVGQELGPPKIRLRNNTDKVVELIGPTETVIECSLMEPDKSAVTMCIAMPTGVDPRRMPPRKLKARATLELEAEGIWYYQDGIGFEPYVFRQEGTHKFKCKYEAVNSNIITIIVRKNGSEKAAAYTFLLQKMAKDRLNLITSRDDESLGLIQDIIRANRLNLEVEGYNNIEKGPDLCQYSKTTGQLVAIIDVAKRGEKNYYVSYYLGPEGGASKEIIIEKINEKWAVANDDGMWSVK